MNLPSRARKWLTLAALAALAVILGACLGSSPDDRGEANPTGEALQALPTLGERPGSVPAEFVFTPNGYFHPSCVIQVGRDERVREDGSIERADGSTLTLPGCEHPRYDRHGRRVARDAVRPDHTQGAELLPSINGWVASGQDSSHGNLQRISANWQVPWYPAFLTGQTLFYFPGLQDFSAILQPVLQYNQAGYPGWTASSWFCCVKGYTWQSSTISVNPGDVLFGSVQGSAFCNLPTGCQQWTVFTEDVTTGQSTALSTIYASGMQDAVGGALEAYNVSTCLQYSTKPSVTFWNIAVETGAGAWPTLSFAPQVTSQSPSCGYAESSTSSTVTVTAIY